MIVWIRKNKLIFLIVLVALILRLWRISEYMTFLGDEGRDALVWLRMTHGKLTLIGPMTSIGNMYLGPLFYYLMFPFFLLLGTAGPSIGTALFAGATTFFLWYCGREWFSEKVGLVAALLYAISPVAITLSRSAWNPNVMPFFALLAIWGIWQFWQKDKYYWLVIEGILLSFAIQSHYLGILLVPVVGLFFTVKLIHLISIKNKNINKFLVSFALCALTFALLTIVPLIWFDLRHDFINYQSFYKFFSERQTTVNLKPYKALPEMWPLWQMLTTRLVAGKNVVAGLCISLAAIIISIVNFISLLRNKKTSKRMKGLLIVGSWVLVGLLGMGLYKQHIYDHYFGFLFPAIFLIGGVGLAWLSEMKLAGKILFWAGLLLLIIFSLKEIPLKSNPNKQMDHTAEVAGVVINEAKGKPFNLGMIAKQNYDAGYRYFLEKWGKKAVEIDAQKAGETITDQLFVVCDEKDCQPVGHSQAEIANFGWSKIENVWEFPWGVKLYKSVHQFSR